MSAADGPPDVGSGGDDDVGAFVAQRYVPMLRLARVLVGEREQAEDLVQDVLATVVVGAGWPPPTTPWPTPTGCSSTPRRPGAVALGVAPSTVRSCARRGLAALRGSGALEGYAAAAYPSGV